MLKYRKLKNIVMCHSDINEKTDDIFICDKRHWKDVLFYFETGVSMDVLFYFETGVSMDVLFYFETGVSMDVLFYFETGVSMDVLETLDHNRKRPRGGWYFFLSLSNFFHIIT